MKKEMYLSALAITAIVACSTNPFTGKTHFGISTKP
jgi:hypothetical protein